MYDLQPDLVFKKMLFLRKKIILDYEEGKRYIIFRTKIKFCCQIDLDHWYVLVVKKFSVDSLCLFVKGVWRD